MLISGTKIDENFPDSQFKIDRFSNPHRIDGNKKGGGIMVLFREDLPVKVLSVDKVIAIFILRPKFYLTLSYV